MNQSSIAGNNKTIFYCKLPGVEVSNNSPAAYVAVAVVATAAGTRKNEERTNEPFVAVISLGRKVRQAT